jgi:ribosome biogenesis GTPase
LIQSYGWSDALQRDFEPHAARGLIPGRIIVQQRGLYDIATDAGELTAQISGRLAHEAERGGYPAR